jgi:hypothetical protein
MNMSIFTSKKVTWRRGIQEHRDSRAEFRQLAQSIGRPKAKLFLELIYDWSVASHIQLTMLTPDMVSDFMKKERENVTFRRQYVNSLVPLCASGSLGTTLNNNLRATGDYYKNPSGVGLAGRDLAIDQAANWICGGFVAGLPATRALLKEYIPTQQGHHGKAGAALGRTSGPICKIHKKAVTNAPAYRFNYMAGDVKYPSTVGASVLLDEIFALTAGCADRTWPAFGDAKWESIAMFYLISIVTIQAFSDGNKRAGHFAYAIVLIKGTHAFKAPTSAKETELFRMNG